MIETTLKDKVPPHDIEAERAVLGALLLNWGAMGDVIGKLRPERFYSLQNQVIFEALTELFSHNIQGDTLTLVDQLRKNNKLEQAGGTAYIASLTDTVPSSANIEYYADIVLDRATRRDLIKISSELKAESFELGRESTALLDTAATTYSRRSCSARRNARSVPSS